MLRSKCSRLIFDCQPRRTITSRRAQPRTERLRQSKRPKKLRIRIITRNYKCLEGHSCIIDIILYIRLIINVWRDTPNTYTYPYIHIGSHSLTVEPRDDTVEPRDCRTPRRQHHQKYQHQRLNVVLDCFLVLSQMRGNKSSTASSSSTSPASALAAAALLAPRPAFHASISSWNLVLAAAALDS